MKNTSHISFRHRLYIIIFEADTPAGKAFDIVLIAAILLSVLVVMLDSVNRVHQQFLGVFNGLEWLFTILFTIEYLARLYCARHPAKYATSFFGVVDLLAILPTYLGLLLPGSHYLSVIRVLRVLRIFRVLKLVQYLGEARLLLRALKASQRKITVFLFTVLTLVIILGSLMYIIEGEEHGFTSIPRSIYWAIVTLTTVGYGDISPQTPLGQALSSLVMILGYSIIAVPTGIVTVEAARASQEEKSRQRRCPGCGASGHDADARFCKYCGHPLKQDVPA